MHTMESNNTMFSRSQVSPRHTKGKVVAMNGFHQQRQQNHQQHQKVTDISIDIDSKHGNSKHTRSRRQRKKRRSKAIWNGLSWLISLAMCYKLHRAMQRPSSTMFLQEDFGFSPNIREGVVPVPFTTTGNNGNGDDDETGRTASFLSKTGPQLISSKHSDDGSAFGSTSSSAGLLSRMSRSLLQTIHRNHDEKLPVVDMISIGSNTRPDYMVAQEETFGSHPSVRNFYAITEHNDTEADCNQLVNKNKLMYITRMKCRPKARRDVGINQTHHPVLFTVSHEFFGFNRLIKEKKNPVGWLCAQKRPMDGLYKVLSKYSYDSPKLPDYVLMMDDDTWFNMDLLLPVLKSKVAPNSLPAVVAGCLISLHYPNIGDTKMQYPWGGFGTIINRATIVNMLRPIQCNSRDKDLCDWIAQDRLMEYQIFQQDQTMSLLELMYRYTFYQPYADVENWKEVGYCFHSDMVLSYFLMYATNNEWTIAFPNSTLGFQGGDGAKGWSMDGGQCLNKFADCDENDILCHYISPRHMHMVHNRISSSTQ
mmetsp:Transcript_29810/g.72236  ORF Transcript_29810/g.72236 Transcript_29810/m.72236 type:complete len:535 (+) Transcript_29810:205-1809(+)